MTLGIILKGLNFIYEKNYLENLFVFIPQLIFKLILFGYMNFLIFIIWSLDYEGKENQVPDIKSYLMNIFLKFGELPQNPEENKDFTWFKRIYRKGSFIYIFSIYYMSISNAYSKNFC
jgi:vacuolar-type H+-ATPase subunit I/STV1